MNTDRTNSNAKWTAALLAAALMAGGLSASATAADATVIKAARVLTATGATFAPGMVLVQDGKIVAVGAALDVPDGAAVIDLPHGVLTPGLVEACGVLDFEVQQSARSYARAMPAYSFWEAIGHIEQHDEDEPSLPMGSAPEDFCPMPHGPAGAEAALAPNRAVFEAMTANASEVTPHRLVMDAVNLFSNDFKRLARNGVTTVYVSPHSGNVIGARGAIVKTAGPLSQRVVQRAAAVKASLGGDPSYRGRPNYLPPTYGPLPTFHTRRPTTRMGVDLVFRKAFYDAQRSRQGIPLHGADMPPAEAIPVLLDVLDGDVPLRIQARMQHDIYSALRLAREFGLRFTLEEATEAYRALPVLAEADVPVIYGPIFIEPSGWRASYYARDEVKRPRLNTPKQLADAGVTFALTAQEMRDEQGLVRQGMMATRFGLSTGDALRAITATPAELIGLGQQVGTLRPGAVADLVVWNEDPFEATSRPLLVLINGEVVHDSR